MLTEDSEWSAFEGISLGVGGLRLQSLDVSEIVPLLAWLWKDLLAFLLSELDWRSSLQPKKCLNVLFLSLSWS